MNSSVIGLYGVYLMLVAYQGNAPTLLSDIADEKGFVPWVVVILILAMLSNYSGTHDFVAPFILIAIVATVVTKFPSIKKQVDDSYNFLTSKTSTK